MERSRDFFVTDSSPTTSSFSSSLFLLFRGIVFSISLPFSSFSYWEEVIYTIQNTARTPIESPKPTYIIFKNNNKKKIPAFFWVPLEPPLSGKVLPPYLMHHFSHGPGSVSSKLQPWEHWSNIGGKQSKFYRFIFIPVGRVGKHRGQDSLSWQKNL